MAQAFPFDAVIFDMDGVIVDTERYYADELRVMSDTFGMHITDAEIFGQVGMSNQDFKRHLVTWWGRAGRTYTGEEALAAYQEWAATRHCDYASLLNPGVPEAIAALKQRGVRVALASSSPMDNIKHVLSVCGLADAFEIIVSGEQFKQSKPNPEIYLHTLDLLGLPAARCCCVEDSKFGIEAGKRAGLTVVAKREDRFGFSQAEADYIVDTVPEVLDVPFARR